MNQTNRSSRSVDHMALRQALDHIASLIGEENITCHEPNASTASVCCRNVSQFRSRDIYAVIYPGTSEEVQEIVRVFNRFKTNAGLHVISIGRNWGLGSAQPATNDVVTINLRRLNALREIDCSSGWAVIEPGVTQVELARLLVSTDRMLNVTASSGYTSVVGNALDRGVGLRRQRVEDLAGLEVVLSNGEIVRVGWWPDTFRKTAVNPYGLGPALLHLFTQSNLGIVTAAVIKLLPRPEKQCVLRLTFPRENLHEAIAELRRWIAQELVSGVLKIYDTVSTQSYGGQPSQHLVLLCVSGTSRRVDAVTKVLIEEAAVCAHFTSITQSDLVPAASNDFVLQVVEHAYAGDPSQNEHMLKAAVGQDADHVDSAGSGWIFFLPFIPFNGEAIARAFELIDLIHEKTGIRAGTTVNALSADLIDLVVSFRFTPNSEEVTRAHQALDLAYELFADAGLFPYRLDIDHTHWREKLTPDPSGYKLISQLTQLLDPNSIIAPGRYA
ncbi:FAD-binding oxidoreductase [Photorhabdus temperata]|uniref:FAD/FMN-dependent dehydrogenase n=1 Tax=Photorhabdus temperata subsp. temperata Meg1 TaxID=1393735 RepID=A0A081S2A0_PHOTE|nr:FAD-binding oxidoreductase [Photorhabdus temperata]KER05053.1 FAD/FMN-dependent dehydrogenase [Photorhabdus temperata subsp. temperata Meg1]MCT8347486.1 FAD-binding oxidoreductase [Photorhabdus temperata]